MAMMAAPKSDDQQEGSNVRWRPSLGSGRAKGGFELMNEGMTEGGLASADAERHFASSSSYATPRHRSTSPSPGSVISSSSQSPAPRHTTQTASSSLEAQGAQGAGTLASAMAFRKPVSGSSSTNLGVQSPAHSPSNALSPSFAAQALYTSGSDHSRHSSGHGSSLTGASQATSGGGFGGFDAGGMLLADGSLASAASSSGEGPFMLKGPEHITSTFGSIAGSPRIGGGLGVPGSFTRTNRPGSKAESFGGALAASPSSGEGAMNLGHVLARPILGNSSGTSLLSPTFNANAEASHKNSLPLPAKQAFEAPSALPSSPFPSGRDVKEPSSTVPVSLPTTGPLSAADPRTQLYISNLPYRVRWQDVKDLFRRAGTVLRADVSLTPDNRSRGIGTVLMATEDDAQRACDMFRGFNWQGRTLEVKIDRSGTILGVGVGHVAPSSLLGMPTQHLPVTPGSVSRGSPMPSPLGSAVQANASPAGSHTSLAPVMSSFAQQHTPSNPQSQRTIMPSPSRQQLSTPSTHSVLGGVDAYPTTLSQRQQVESTLPQQSGRNTSTGLQVPSHPQQIHVGSTYGQSMLLGEAPHAANPMFAQARLGARDGMAPYAGAQAGLASNLPPYGASQAHQMSNMTYSGIPDQQQLRAPPNTVVNGLTANRSGPMAGSIPSPFVPSMPPVAHSYYGRVLFVGNLPFHCQWQDLKDLFRAAGNIQRADVALSPDGKSRGFGTVLFATPEDARNAVRIYHGYEYSGRTLKVHFDRFAQMTVPQPGALPASPSHYTSAFVAANTPSHVATGGAGMPGGGPGASLPQSFPQGSFEPNSRTPQSVLLSSQGEIQPQHQRQKVDSHLQSRGTSLPPKPLEAALEDLRLSDSRRGSAVHGAVDALRPNVRTQGSDTSGQGTLSIDSATYVPQHEEKATTNSQTTTASAIGGNAQPMLSAGRSDVLAGDGRFRSRLPADAGRGHSSNSGAHPGRIALPPQGFAPPIGSGVPPFSPMQTRMNVPMTPGMPGFNFHGIPQTPPVHQSLFSTGLGALLSPGIGSPSYGPGTPGLGFNGLINPAPGAPVHYNNGTTTPMASMITMATAPGFNPMFPPLGMANQSGVYQQHQHPSTGASTLPQTPHWSQPRPPPPPQQHFGARQYQHQPRKDDSVPNSHRPQTVGEGDETIEAAETSLAPVGSTGGSSSQARSGGEPEGYPFPSVGEAASGETSPAPLQRRNSTNTPLLSPTAPNGPASLAVKSPGWEHRRGSTSGIESTSAANPAKGSSGILDGLGLHHIHVSAGATTTEELARKIARMSAEKSLRQHQAKTSSGATGESALSNRALAAPLELGLGGKDTFARQASALTGSAVDDGNSSADSQPATSGLDASKDDTKDERH